MSAWRSFRHDRVGAAEGLAFDEAMMLAHGRGESDRPAASLRLYTYRAHCALVGRYQSLEEEIDLDTCRELDAQVGRRPTGGGAILMGPGQLGVALAARAEPEESPRQALLRYAGGVIAGLAALGVESRFRNKNDLEVGGRKIAGLGLYLDPRGAVLFHSSVLVDLDVALMLRLLRIPGAKLSDKAVSRVEERVTTVARERDEALEAAAVRDRFAAGLARHFGVELAEGRLSAAEEARYEELRSTRYGHRDWIFQRSPRRDARGSALLKTPEGLLRIYVGVHGGAIKSVLVSGDFNLLPPGVPRLEAALRWCRADAESIAARAAETLRREDLGVEPQRVARAVWEATAAALELARESHPRRTRGSCYLPETAADGERPAPAGEPR